MVGKLLIGAHMSISGGIDQAILRGAKLGCEAVQVFTKSNMQWAAKELSQDEVERFAAACKELHIWPVVAHNCYLINLGAHDPALAKKSYDSFLMEIGRAARLGIPWIIAHPGAHMGAGEEKGLRQIGRALDQLLQESSSSPQTGILIETTAGQGSTIGHRFEHLAELISMVKEKRRIGICFDTAHTFAAGYDTRTPDAYEKTMQELDRIVGLKYLHAFHLNDSKSDLGSHVDRHEHIGKGKLGLTVFRLILRDPRFRAAPKILETPKGKRGKIEWDAINLRTLRQLAEKG